MLAPIMFAVYVSDMTEGVESYMSLFADDAKIMRRLKNEEDCNLLQMDKVWEWSEMWGMEFNIKKVQCY